MAHSLHSVWHAVVKVAHAAGKTPAQVLLRWSLQRGIPTVVGGSEQQLKEAAEGAFDWRLSQEHMVCCPHIPHSFLLWEPHPCPPQSCASHLVFSLPLRPSAACFPFCVPILVTRPGSRQQGIKLRWHLLPLLEQSIYTAWLPHP
jgi:hypothetical protein